MSDGIPGRDHTYAYLRGYDGKWYKSLDATVTEVRGDHSLGRHR